jgi:hypothetical protein
VEFTEARLSREREERRVEIGFEVRETVQYHEQEVRLSRILLHAKTLTRHSFFGDQEGDFSLTIKSIKAVSQSLDLEGGIATGQNVRLRAGSRL